MNLTKLADAPVERRPARYLRLGDRQAPVPALRHPASATDQPLVLNDPVWLCLPSEAVLPSQVVWVRDDECGLALDRSIEADAPRAPSHFRPGIRVKVLGDGGEERTGFVRWLSGNIASVQLIAEAAPGSRSADIH